MVQAGNKLKWLGFRLLFMVIVGFFGLLNFRLMTGVDYPNIDFNYFYAGGRVLIQGGDPYNTASIQEIYSLTGRTRLDPLVSAFPYPLWTAFIFSPFGLFSLDWATTLWTIFNELCLALTIGLLCRVLLKGVEPGHRVKRLKFILFWTLLLFLPGRSFVKALLNGQTVFLTTLLVACFIYGLAFERPTLPGLSLLVGVLKPTSFMLFLVLGLLYLIKEKHWKSLYIFSLGLSVLTLACFIINPGWVGEWLSARTEQGWQIITRIATVWGTSYYLSVVMRGAWLFPVIAAFLGLGLLLTGAYFWQKKFVMLENPVLNWGLMGALSIYLSLYAFSYESVVLIIPLMGLLGLVEKYTRQKKALVISGLGIILLLVPWLLSPLKTPLDEISAGIFPLSLVIFSWLVIGLLDRPTVSDLKWKVAARQKVIK